MVPVLLRAISFNREAMQHAVDSSMFATDRAVELSLRGVPFREAYQQVANELNDPSTLTDRSAARSIAERTSPGACADLQLDVLAARLTSVISDHS